MNTLKLIGTWVLTMSCVAVVVVGLWFVWLVAATAVAIEDIKG